MKRFPLAVQENPPLAPHRLRDQEVLGLGVVETGGVELDEFHVGHADPGPVADGHPVAGGDVGVAGVEIDLAGAAGGQQDDGGDEGVDLTGVLIENVNTDAGFFGIGDDGAPADQLVPGDQIHGDVVFVNGDVGLLQDWPPGCSSPPGRSCRGHG